MPRGSSRGSFRRSSPSRRHRRRRVTRATGPTGTAPAYAPGYVDERLDRLSSAEAAGYLVVRRRTVQFPDGRTLRVYRPDDAGEAF
ncbi:hypothetical protein ACU4GR_16300 [Methylobacterium oryzae CBMB20]